MRILFNSQLCNDLPFVPSTPPKYIACIDLAKTLSLNVNQFGDIGAEKIAESLPRCDTILRAALAAHGSKLAFIHMFLSPFFAVQPIRCFGKRLSETNLNRGWQRNGWAGRFRHLFD